MLAEVRVYYDPAKASGRFFAWQFVGMATLKHASAAGYIPLHTSLQPGCHCLILYTKDRNASPFFLSSFCSCASGPFGFSSLLCSFL